ncbi:MAG: hypothetical protein FJY07_13385, partial [Bacteroidetes bacterium]|nr:hypothetical protein [Bacteroidota bacterium]
MQNKKLYYQINELINGLQRLIQNRESALDPISRIELDIALEKVRRLYDLLLQIEVVDSETEKPEETITEVAEVNEISGEPVSESVSENKPGPDMGDISAKDVPVRESTDEEHKIPEAELITQPNLKATRAKEPDLFSVPELPF